jgi:ABC-type siderophore export system fused ATPase/permease subunit
MSGFVKNILSQSNTTGARSTALHSLQWAMAIIFSSLATLIYLKAPHWLIVALAIMLGVLVILFVFAYLFLLFKNPDALRSEQYTLSKMALEKGLVGDSLSGLSPYTENPHGRTIDSKVEGISHE